MNQQQTLAEYSAKVRHDAKETSRIAALRVVPNSASQRGRVLAAIRSAGASGYTDDEVSSTLRMSPNSVRPRRLELVEGGWVIDSGKQRDSFYGNPAIVWIANPSIPDNTKMAPGAKRSKR